MAVRPSGALGFYGGAFTFGEVAVVLPLGNQDLESRQALKPGELEATAAYLQELAAYLHASMGGHDFNVLRESLNQLA